MNKPGQSLYSFLWELGYFKRIDIVFLASWSGGLIALLVALFKGTVLVQMLIGSIWLAMWMAWVVVLFYRCMYFVLQVRSDMKLLPVDAAKIVMSYQRTASS
jgi:hypothetical protein